MRQLLRLRLSNVVVTLDLLLRLLLLLFLLVVALVVPLRLLLLLLAVAVVVLLSFLLLLLVAAVIILPCLLLLLLLVFVFIAVDLLLRLFIILLLAFSGQLPGRELLLAVAVRVRPIGVRLRDGLHHHLLPGHLSVTGHRVVHDAVVAVRQEEESLTVRNRVHLSCGHGCGGGVGGELGFVGNAVSDGHEGEDDEEGHVGRDAEGHGGVQAQWRVCLGFRPWGMECGGGLDRRKRRRPIELGGGGYLCRRSSSVGST
ncbi:hypothetical protein C2845_PM12G08650 [Panicum miliaceum]|uniref:Uncharacterized protein n=1 Tax=Panicum miliaceum TaxID=4540 RepID=A0A3L6QH42_PANMI|nr:hypothetical protein C2845_PM12G08650 [Panicum miliaceum]